MSRPSRKNRPSRKQIKPHKPKTAPADKGQSRKTFVVLIVVIILAAIPFVLGKYMELNTPDPYDSGAYVYSAQHILNGAEIGVEEIPSARLGTLLVNMLGVSLSGFNETGPKLIQAVFQAAALVLMFIAMRKLFGLLSAAIGVIIASFYLSAPLIAKFGNVKDQYMIAFMVIAISCLVLRQTGGKWYWAFLAGAFLSWAPLFKETGTSAIGAAGVFLIAQPLLKHRTWKQTGGDILLLFAGAAAALGPIFIWMIGWNVKMDLPYQSIWKEAIKMLPDLSANAPTGSAAATEAAKAVSGYIGKSRELIPFAEQWPRVLRYYRLLILPIALAAGAIAAALIRIIMRWMRKLPPENKTDYDRFVLLFGIWWVLDMAFVWISPRSYDQYYLSLNASAAMLGGYLIALYSDKLARSVVYKTRWRIVGIVGFICMIAMSQHIFFGITKSPYSNTDYGRRNRGYIQRLKSVANRKKGLKDYSEVVGEYIRIHSTPTDKIYVWGWYPGVYVAAQRFSSSARAFMIPRQAPPTLEKRITTMLAEFERERPKFIVDSRKNHVPMNRPPFELWPIAPKGFFKDSEGRRFLRSQAEAAAYDKWYSQQLRNTFDQDEAACYQAIKPLRDFIMKNYKIVRMFGRHVLFERK